MFFLLNTGPSVEQWAPQMRCTIFGILFFLSQIYNASYQGYIQQQAQIIIRQQQEINQRDLAIVRRAPLISFDLTDVIHLILNNIINLIEEK